MSKRAFGSYYYSMENSYATKREAEKDAKRLRKTGKYYVRVAHTDSAMANAGHPWAVYLRSRKG